MNTLLSVVLFICPVLLIISWIYFIIKLNTIKTGAKNKEISYESEITSLKKNSMYDLWQSWLNEITNHDFRNEIEVEVLFVAMLIRLLGVKTGNYKIRVPVNLRLGSQEIKGEADWVVYCDGIPVLVIEVKAKYIELKKGVQDQARSYAIGLKVKHYMILNSFELKIYQTELQEDLLIFNCTTNELSARWAELENHFMKICSGQ
jgi:hypothetical protein